MLSIRRCELLVVAAAAAVLASCAADAPLTEPENTPSVPPELPAVAISLTVDLGRGEVTPSPPPAGDSGVRAADGLRFALVGGNEVRVLTSNFFRSEVGEFLPGKVRVRFDVALVNRLLGGALETPTFPRPPLGEQSLMLFPFSVSQINDRGEVSASPDWDLGPHNFFNDAVCRPGLRSDCYRYEPYPSPLDPGATSEARTIGFDVDPQVRTFQLDMVLAADIRNVEARLGSVSGTVSSPQRGPLEGVTVTASPGGQSGVTGADGGYLITNRPAGSVTLALGGLPDDCTDPAPQTVTVAVGATTTANISVACTAVDGTRIRGSVSSDRGEPLAGVSVTVSPGGQTAVTGADGRYEVGISAVTVTLALGDLPAGCLDPGPRTISGFGGAVSPDFLVPCPGVEGAAIRGSVLDDRGRPLAGVTVTASPGGQTAVTSADGRYQIGASAVTVTLALSSLPAGCLDPGPRTISGFGGSNNPDFSVPCPGVNRAVLRGKVFSDRGRALAGVRVTVAPGDQTAVTGDNGRYEVATTAVNVTLTLSDLPPGCLDPGPRTISSFGGAVDPDFFVPCPGVAEATVRGSVLSDRGDPLAGVVVTASPGGQTAVTGQDGRYEVATTAVTVTLSLSNLPAGCLDPGPRVVSGFGAAPAPDFSVPCLGAEGATITGSVTSEGGGALAGVSVTVSPGGQVAVTDGNGRYAVAISTVAFTLSLGGLPAGCLDPGPRAIDTRSGLTDPNFLVPCPGIAGASRKEGD